MHPFCVPTAPHCDPATRQTSPASLATGRDFFGPWTVFHYVATEPVSWKSSLIEAPRAAAVNSRIVAGRRLDGVRLEMEEDLLDIMPLTLPSGVAADRNHALLLAEVSRSEAGPVHVCAGADWRMRWWVNGEEVFSTFTQSGNDHRPPGPIDHDFHLPLRAGQNLIAVELLSGANGFALHARPAPPDLAVFRARTALAAAPHIRRDHLRADAFVTVNCARNLGPFTRPESHHCIRLADAHPETVEAARRHFGRGKITRVFGLMSGEFFPGNMHAVADAADRLARIRRLADYSDELLTPVPHDDVKALCEGRMTEQAYRQNAAAAIVELASLFDNPLHLEVFNESECGDHVLSESDYVRCYRLWREALETARGRLPAGRRITLGGPSPCSFNRKRIQALLDHCAASPADRAALDFLSWHQYLFHTEDRPRRVAATELTTVRAWLAERDLPAGMPCLVNETGVFPTSQQGSSLPDDFLTQATGILSLHYWYQEQGPQVIPFHWTWAHANPRKNLFVPTEESLAYLGRILRIDTAKSRELLAGHLATCPDRLTPYGHAVRLQAMLPPERLACETGPRDDEGLGLYAIAATTTDTSELAVLLWNYQWTDYADPQTFAVRLALEHLPPSLQGRALTMNTWLLDRANGNFLGGTPDPLHTRQTLPPASSDALVVNVPLPANAVMLLKFRPS